MTNGPYIVDETCLVFAKNIEEENERLRERLAEADEANRRVSDENKKLRAEIMSDYHEGLEEGVKAERERIACKFDSRPHDFWSGEAIAAAIRESGDE